MNWLPLAVLAALAWLAGPAQPGVTQAWAQTTFPADVYMCSGHPWIDVRCNGAVGDDSHDDTSAIQTTIDSAIAGGWPIFLPAGTYKVTSELTADFAGIASSGFRMISEGATIDGRSIASGPVLQVECSGGSPSSPTACFYFHEDGTLFVNATTPGYAVLIGLANFADQQNSLKIDHLIVNNSSTNAAAGACQFNAIYDSDIFAVCDSTGGAAGIALEQTQFSRISGAGSANGTGGRAMVLENGYSFSNTFMALDLEASPTCLSVTNAHNGNNTWLSPYFNCTTALSSTGSNNNVLINPQYAAVTNFGPLSTGFTVLGQGSRAQWMFPASATYTAAPVDDGLSLSSYNAPGSSMAVTLPSITAVNPGWSMGFATDNGKGMTIAAPSGSILLGGKALPLVTLGAGNYEYIKLQSDGNNWRVVSSTRSTRLNNGFEPPPWPSNWLYPSASGYAAALADNGNIISSYNSSGPLTVTLPSTTNLPDGWSMGFATDNGNGLTVQVNGVSGGHLIYPGSGAAQTTATMASGFPGQVAYEFMVVQYDGTGSAGNFRIVSATPATAAALNMLGSAGGPLRWSFPSGSTAYAATAADNGNVISSYNSSSSFLALTLPSTTAINRGWTIGIAADNGKTMSVQVNATSGGTILLGGTSGGVSAFSLAALNGTPFSSEDAVLQYDGSGNFRVIHMSPASANALGLATVSGTPASGSAACQTGEIAQDSNYLYVCTAPSTWKAVALGAYP